MTMNKSGETGNQNYLYIQKVLIFYHKDVRYSNFAEQRKAIRFYPKRCFAEKAVLLQKSDI